MDILGQGSYEDVMITAKRIAGALRDLPLFAPKLAGALRDAGDKVSLAVGAVEAIGAAAAPAAEILDAFREGRVELDMQDGRFGVRVKPRPTTARDGRVSF